MPYATSVDGTRIHFVVRGRGPLVLLHHGFGRSHACWDRHADALATDMRVVALDARGHGKSDKPHDEPAYALERRMEDVAAVVEAVGEGPPTFWGYSMGGRLAYGLMAHAPTLCARWVVGGMHGFDEPPDVFAEQLSVLERGMEAFADARGATGAERERLLAEDPRALAACKRVVGRQQGLVPGLRRVTAPVLVYAGSRDPMHERARQTAALVPSARFLSLEGLDHGRAAERHAEVVAAVRELVR